MFFLILFLLFFQRNGRSVKEYEISFLLQRVGREETKGGGGKGTVAIRGQRRVPSKS
jgi:hypothetical protein